MPKPGAPPIWIELSLDRSASEIRVSARGSRGERIAPRSLGTELDVPSMLSFADAVRQAAARGKPLGPSVIADAQAAERALLADDAGPLLAALREAADGPLLV